MGQDTGTFLRYCENYTTSRSLSEVQMHADGREKKFSIQKKNCKTLEGSFNLF